MASADWLARPIAEPDEVLARATTRDAERVTELIRQSLIRARDDTASALAKRVT